MELVKTVLFFICINCVLCSIHYKSSVVDVSRTNVANSYDTIIQEAAKHNIDLLVLSSSRNVVNVTSFETCDPDNYDEVMKSVSKSAKAAKIYVVIQMYEKTSCHHRPELFFTSVVFDRDGGIVAVYRDPVSVESKCNNTEAKIVKFHTDFGVTFALVAEEDIILHKIDHFDDIKNFIVTSSQNIPNSLAEQFTSSWSYVNEVNVISPVGVFGGKINAFNNITVAELQKKGGSSPLITTSSSVHHHMKPLNRGATTGGYTDTVCDGNFCCNFYVKTSYFEPDATYFISASEYVLQLGQKSANLQTCFVGSKNKNSIKFDKISITANFTRDSALYPTASTVEPSAIHNLNIRNNTNVELYDATVISFGVLSRDHSKDSIVELNDVYVDYISYGNVQEFFDYVWIRVRVLLFIVSIYVLEMM